MRTLRHAALATIVALLASSVALAARRPFLFAFDTQTLAKGDVELEQWLSVRGRMPDGDARCQRCHTGVDDPNRPLDPDLSSASLYWVWWAPVIGITNRVEVALPFQIKGNNESTVLDSIEADVRVRLLSREEDHWFEPLVRVAYHQPINGVLPPRFDVNLVGSLGGAKQLHFTLDLGGRIGLPFFGRHPERKPAVIGTYGAALAYPLMNGELQLSAELRGEMALANLQEPNGFPRHFAGGAVSWTFGRFWVTGGMLFGLHFLSPAAPNLMARLGWGMAL